MNHPPLMKEVTDPLALTLLRLLCTKYEYLFLDTGCAGSKYSRLILSLPTSQGELLRFNFDIPHDEIIFFSLQRTELDPQARDIAMMWTENGLSMEQQCSLLFKYSMCQELLQEEANPLMESAK